MFFIKVELWAVYNRIVKLSHLIVLFFLCQTSLQHSDMVTFADSIGLGYRCSRPCNKLPMDIGTHWAFGGIFQGGGEYPEEFSWDVQVEMSGWGLFDGNFLVKFLQDSRENFIPIGNPTTKCHL